MKPLKLTMQAFGPFAEREEVDFAFLEHRAFFLIHGATGSGKTTILDAVCFALYGVASGVERGGERSGVHLRSDHAAEETPTEVELEFSLGSDLYRIRRLPRQDRPRKRGEGTVTTAPEAELLQMKDDWRVMAAGWKEVTARVEELIGFRCEQFRQVVILPQGEFRRLLSSDSRQRQEILAVLFNTRIYHLIEKKLAERAAGVSDQLALQRERRDVLHNQAGVSSAKDFTEVRNSRRLELTEAGARAGKLRRAAEAAGRRLAEGREANRKLDEAEAARKRLEEIEVQRERMAEEEKAVRLARTALGLADVENDLRSRKEDSAADAAKLGKTVKLRGAADRDRERKLKEQEELKARTREMGEPEILVGLVAGLEAAASEKKRVVQQARKLEELARKVSGSEREIERIDGRLRRAGSLLERARQRVERQRVLWESDAAGRLAQNLVPDQPCPVCGSLEHPGPAAKGELSSGPAMLETAAGRVARIEKVRDGIVAEMQRARNESGQHQGAAAALREELGDAAGASAESLAAEERRISGELKAARGDQEKAGALAGKVRSLEERIKESEARCRELEGIEKAQRAAALESERLAAERKTYFEDRIREAGFDDRAAYEAARRKPGEIEAIEKRVGRYREDAAVARKSAREKDGLASGLERADCERLEQDSRRAGEALEEGIRECARIESRIKEDEKLSRKIEVVEERTRNLEASYGILGRLASAARGNNDLKLALERYVLAALFDDVARSATARLKIMSQGRYELYRASSPGDQRRAGGLELEVLDSWTGVERPVSTLSGGESFLAALSLAMGLADVVQSFAGGVRLETIFIDEGFGTLDPESLDLALRALQDLQENGRLVGIISHVPELKERIDARLEILRTREGSRTRFVVS